MMIIGGRQCYDISNAILIKMNEKIILKKKENVEIISVDNNYLISYRGKNWKISRIVYEVLLEFDGDKSKEEILNEVNLKYSNEYNFSMKNLDTIISFMERNNLLIGTRDVGVKSSGNKMLWGRITIIPAKIVEKMEFLKVLYNRKVFIILLPLVCLWIFSVFINNAATDMIKKLYSMNIFDIILCYFYIIVIGLFHEIGHSVALMKNNQPPGRIGAAIYFIMPVLFSDVTRAYRLNRKNRILVDIGGIYFQGILSVFLFLLNINVWENNILDFALIMTAIQIVGNFNPFIKLDGYWIISDYFNTEDIRKLFLSFIFGTVRKKQNNAKLSKSQVIVLMVYGIAFFLFMVYFVKMLLSSLVIAITNIYSDLGALIDQGVSFIGDNWVKYVSNRVLDVIVVVFSIRLIIVVAKKVYYCIKEKRRKNEDN